MVLACVAAVVGAVTAVVAPANGLRFVQEGHWVAQPDSDLVVHVDGEAKTVDARVPIPGLEPGSSVVHGETSGYVVSRTRIVEFGKSTLTVEGTMPAPADEEPVAVETPGGPYLVYREAGTVVRLGPKHATVRVPGPLGVPVATPDGTLWLHRLDANVLCRLPRDAERITCPAVAPQGHDGALTVVGTSAVFVDVADDTLHAVSADGLGPAVRARIDLPEDADVAPRDAGGRIAVLDDAADRLLLVDAAGLDPGRTPDATVPVDLPRGEFATPAVSGSAVVVLDRSRGTVLTYASDGTRLRSSTLPTTEGDPQLATAEDGRVYVTGRQGRQVLVVDHDGGVHTVVAGPGPDPSSRPPSSRPERPDDTETPQSTDRDQRVSVPGDEERTPTPDPPGPPGLPPGVTAEADGTTVTVTWGAARSNGARVTSYHVTWDGPSAAAATKTVPGSARSTVLRGLDYGRYTITVRAENSAGRSAPATASVTVERTPEVTVTRGTTDSYDGCEPPECATMLVVLRNFEPNTEYEIIPYSTNTDYSNPGSRQTTDENGYVSFEAFHFESVGEEVWVVVDGRWTSNRYVWEAE